MDLGGVGRARINRKAEEVVKVAGPIHPQSDLKSTLGPMVFLLFQVTLLISLSRSNFEEPAASVRC